MATSANPLIESILSLTQTQRAELAVQILQSLELPGEEISSEEYGQELRSRVEKYRNGEMESVSLDDAREILEKRISAGPSN
ncbi:addiction module protein [Bythopirellula goksoeyrii]|uniref:addiction module protein n=1 Tax=Bythopirellula goksoeyrii TaxID=1400387 RepID=UPI001AEFC5CC|nr:addiction module protein [Bythopirellula goksoeyrii]